MKRPAPCSLKGADRFVCFIQLVYLLKFIRKEAAVLQRRLIHRLRHYKCRNDIQQQAGAPNKAQQRRGNANHRGVPPHIFCQTAAHTGQHFAVPLAKTLLVHTKSSLWFCDSFRHRRIWNSA